MIMINDNYYWSNFCDDSLPLGCRSKPGPSPSAHLHPQSWWSRFGGDGRGAGFHGDTVDTSLRAFSQFVGKPCLWWSYQRESIQRILFFFGWYIYNWRIRLCECIILCVQTWMHDHVRKSAMYGCSVTRQMFGKVHSVQYTSLILNKFLLTSI